MSHLDRIYCFTCKQVSLDIAPIKIQDSRFNPKWQDRCVHCLSFKTVNASLFLESGKKDIFIKIADDPLKGKLKKLGEQMVKEELISNYKIRKLGKHKYRLYERRHLKKELKKAVDIFDKTYNK